MKLTEEALQALSQAAVEAAKIAGVYIQSQVGTVYETQNKGDHLSQASQVVTEIDVEAQRLILQALEETISTFDLGLLTEESTDDHSRLEKDYFWCVDPMDGTLAFTEGRTGYAVSIALINKGGDPVVGVVYIPDLQDCYAGVSGMGVQLNGQPFEREQGRKQDIFKLFMDRSFPAEQYHKEVIRKVSSWSQKDMGCGLELQVGFGAVRNAIAVMIEPAAGYFKFPKTRPGGGSIWDFAATRLFFDEMSLSVSTARKDRLHLNAPDSTFMNQTGVIYSTSPAFSNFIFELGDEVDRH